MGRKNIVSILIMVIAITALAAFLAGCEDAGPDVPPPPITTFGECAEAGNPILESYPRQCNTPDGKNFVEDVEEGACLKDADCGEGLFCNRGECLEFIISTDCVEDKDCALIDSEFNLGCCWATKCKPIDYSDDEWIAVNWEWFTGQQEEYCPSEDVCGPAPMCSEVIKNKMFKASCVESACEKVPS